MKTAALVLGDADTLLGQPVLLGKPLALLWGPLGAVSRLYLAERTA
jgi:hypothetical protein